MSILVSNSFYNLLFKEEKQLTNVTLKKVTKYNNSKYLDSKKESLS